MKTKFIAIMTALIMITSLSTACIGTMAVSGKLRAWNLEVAQKRWSREFSFLGLYMVGAYPIAGLVDLLVVNSMEFWTGTNPVNQKPSVTPVGSNGQFSTTKTFTTDDGSVVTMTHELDDSITTQVVSSDGDISTLSLERSQYGVTLEDEQGNIVMDTATHYLSPQLSEIL